MVKKILDEKILDRLWERDRKLFMELYYEGIKTRGMVDAFRFADFVFYEEILGEVTKNGG